ncbi:MAG: thioredoxin family protein, partial [Planctomycetota bacterium]
MKILLLIVGLVVIAWLFTRPPSTSSTSAVHASWPAGWEQASKQALASGQPILADFTGSDWCGWCIKLRKEVFDTPEFTAWAKKKVVLLEVDFPQQKQLAAEQSAENDRLAKRYAIQGFPTILLLDAKGTELGRLSYQEG